MMLCRALAAQPSPGTKSEKERLNMKNDANMERLVADVRTLSRDAGAVLRATSGVAGEKMSQLRERLSVALESAKATCHKLEQKVVAGAKATEDVRTAAVDMAIAAAEKILRDKVAGAGGAALIDESIRSIKTRLN